MINISTNRSLMEEGSIETRIKSKELSYDELQILIVESLAKIIGEDSVDKIFSEARNLVTSYLNYTTKQFVKTDVLDFMDTREQWKSIPEIDSNEEAAAIIIESAYIVMSEFCRLVSSDSDYGFVFKDIILIIASINYIEENK